MLEIITVMALALSSNAYCWYVCLTELEWRERKMIEFQRLKEEFIEQLVLIQPDITWEELKVQMIPFENRIEDLRFQVNRLKKLNKNETVHAPRAKNNRNEVGTA